MESDGDEEKCQWPLLLIWALLVERIWFGCEWWLWSMVEMFHSWKTTRSLNISQDWTRELGWVSRLCTTLVPLKIEDWPNGKDTYWDWRDDRRIYVKYNFDFSLSVVVIDLNGIRTLSIVYLLRFTSSGRRHQSLWQWAAAKCKVLSALTERGVNYECGIIFCTYGKCMLVSSRLGVTHCWMLVKFTLIVPCIAWMC